MKITYSLTLVHCLSVVFCTFLSYSFQWRHCEPLLMRTPMPQCTLQDQWVWEWGNPMICYHRWKLRPAAQHQHVLEQALQKTCRWTMYSITRLQNCLGKYIHVTHIHAGNHWIMPHLLTVFRHLPLDQGPSILNACQVVLKQLLFVFLGAKQRKCVKTTTINCSA